MAISNIVRSRSVNEGMQMEAVTIDGWLRHIERLLPVPAATVPTAAIIDGRNDHVPTDQKEEENA